MAASIAFRCDICGNPKRETNHWWMILTGEANSENSGHNHVENSDGHVTIPERRFLVVPWQAELATREGVHHACGQFCVQRAMERFMSQQEIFPEPTPAEAAYALEADPNVDFDFLVNSVAESVVQSALEAPMVVPSELPAAAFSNSDPLACDMDEYGELSAVLSPARPKIVARPQHSHAA
jgi:hypothetical protein